MRQSAIALVLLAGLSRCIAADHPVDAGIPGWPFDSAVAGIRAVDDPDRIGFANRHVAILFRRSDGSLLGIWSPAAGNMIAASAHVPLWSVDIIPEHASAAAVVSADATRTATFTLKGDDKTRILTSISQATGADGVSCSVTMQVAIRDDSPALRWRLESVQTTGGKLWSAKFPQLPVAGFDADPSGNFMVIPYRRGEERPFGKSTPKSELSLPYPGPAAKFQFMAAYGKSSGHGFYYAAEDGDGFSKAFWLTNSKTSNSITFATEHFPENRGGNVRSWRMPYEIVTEPFTGDWWHAARIYREWWVKQIWASKGLIEQRRDVPDWLKRSSIAVRFHTGPHRTLEKNQEGLHALDKALNCAPFIGTWYDYTLPPDREKIANNNYWGHGHLLPPQLGVTDALRDMKSRQIYWMAYVQSLIYQSEFPGDDNAAADGAAARDEHGKRAAYADGTNQTTLWTMCRATDWWQTRMVDQCRKAIDAGFSGVYLDSFGKGSDECFAPNHGHPLGGGNTMIAGQRAMAQRIRTAIRAQNPEAIMAGEDPIEAFRDLLDVHLYSVNVSKDYVPIYRTVWGDYSLGHGRTIGPAKDARCVIPELASLFLEGTILGRFPCDGGDSFLAQAENARTLGFMKSLLAYMPQTHRYLRFGEYLHPLALSPPPPLIEFKESTRGQHMSLPAVLHSVTRSHTDGIVAVVLINIGNEKQKAAVPIDPSLRFEPADKRATLSRMDPKGKLTEVGAGTTAWNQAIELEPLEIIVLVLR